MEEGESQRVTLMVARCWQNWQRNFWLGVINGVLFKVGVTFSHPSTVLSVFLTKLTGSEIFAGALMTIMGLGWFLPSLFVSGYIEALPRKMPLYFRMAFGRLLGWVSMLLVVLFVAPKSGVIAALLFLAGYGLFTIAGGLGTTAFMDIFARTVPLGRRGMFWGLRMFLGSLLGIAVGVVIRFILKMSTLPFPYDYAVLMTLSLIAFSLAWGCFLMVREPLSEPKPPPQSLREQWEHLKRVWYQSPELRQLIKVRFLLDFGLIALPFYSTYAVKELHAPPSLLGTFIVAETFGSLLANLFWSVLADRKGNLFVLRYAVKFASFPPAWVIALTVARNWLGNGVLSLYPLTYFFLAVSLSGTMIALFNYVLEIAEEGRRPTFFALSNVAESAMVILPLIGGFLLHFLPYPTLFFIALFGALNAARQVGRLGLPYRSMTK